MQVAWRDGRYTGSENPSKLRHTADKCNKNWKELELYKRLPEHEKSIQCNTQNHKVRRLRDVKDIKKTTIQEQQTLYGR